MYLYIYHKQFLIWEFCIQNYNLKNVKNIKNVLLNQMQ